MSLLHLPLLAALAAGPLGPPAPSPWRAADPDPGEAAWQVEVALRALAGTGRTSYALYDNLGFVLVSALDFHGLGGAGAELAARATGPRRLWLTAALGLDARRGGTLQDEDFPVGDVTTYSSTDSAQRGGGAWHVAAGVGYDVHQAPTTRLGFFAGARHAAETLHAHGCVQTAANTQICGGGGIPSSVRVITARTRWTAPMLGVDGALRLGAAVTASASAALLPFVSVSGSDTHWLRTGPQAPGIDFSGPTPITASNGLGVALEGAVRWRAGPGLSLGLGGRFIRLEARRGLMHFERSVYPTDAGSAAAQVLSLVTERRLAWVEAGWRF